MTDMRSRATTADTPHDLYRTTKDLVVEYLVERSPQELERTCLACPAWTVREVIAHHIHAQRCVVDGTFEPRALQAIAGEGELVRNEAIAARDEWTQAGVDERAGRSLVQLLMEWDAVVGRLSGKMMALTVDLTVHFDDVRETLEGELPRSGPDIPFTLGRFQQIQSLRFTNNGEHPVLLRTTDGDSYGDPAAGTTVTGPEYELLRCVTSRRNRSVADGVLDWGNTTEESRSLFAVYGWSAE